MASASPLVVRARRSSTCARYLAGKNPLSVSQAADLETLLQPCIASRHTSTSTKLRKSMAWSLLLKAIPAFAATLAFGKEKSEAGLTQILTAVDHPFVTSADTGTRS